MFNPVKNQNTPAPSMRLLWANHRPVRKGQDSATLYRINLTQGIANHTRDCNHLDVMGGAEW